MLYYLDTINHIFVTGLDNPTPVLLDTFYENDFWPIQIQPVIPDQPDTFTAITDYTLLKVSVGYPGIVTSSILASGSLGWSDLTTTYTGSLSFRSDAIRNSLANSGETSVPVYFEVVGSAVLQSSDVTLYQGQGVLYADLIKDSGSAFTPGPDGTVHIVSASYADTASFVTITPGRGITVDGMTVNAVQSTPYLEGAIVFEKGTSQLTASNKLIYLNQFGQSKLSITGDIETSGTTTADTLVVNTLGEFYGNVITYGGVDVLNTSSFHAPVHGIMDFAISSSWASSSISSSYATTSSYSTQANVANLALKALYADNAGKSIFSISSSWASSSLSASVATSASAAISASYAKSAASPILPTDIVNKDYVDNLISQNFDLYFRSSSSDIADYHQMLRLDTPIGSQYDIGVNNVSGGQYPVSFASEPLGISSIQRGTIVVHAHLYRQGGSGLTVHPEIYIRSASVEIFEFEGGSSQVLTTNAGDSYTLPILITSSYATRPTDRLILKFKVDAASGLPNFHCVVEGTTAAGISIPVPSSNFVLKTADTMTGTLTGPGYIGTASWAGAVVIDNVRSSIKKQYWYAKNTQSIKETYPYSDVFSSSVNVWTFSYYPGFGTAITNSYNQDYTWYDTSGVYVTQSLYLSASYDYLFT